MPPIPLIIAAAKAIAGGAKVHKAHTHGKALKEVAKEFVKEKAKESNRDKRDDKKKKN